MTGDVNQWNRDRLALARQEGEKARRAGKSIHENPYERVSYAQAWEDGFNGEPVTALAMRDAPNGGENG